MQKASIINLMYCKTD